MKIKIFTMHEKFADSRKRYLEYQVNTWLEENPDIEVVNANMSSSYEENLTYTIMYKEAEAIDTLPCCPEPPEPPPKRVIKEGVRIKH